MIDNSIASTFVALMYKQKIETNPILSFALLLNDGGVTVIFAHRGNTVFLVLNNDEIVEHAFMLEMLGFNGK